MVVSVFPVGKHGYIVIVNFCEYDVNNYLQGSDTTPPSAGMVEEELQLTRARYKNYSNQQFLIRKYFYGKKNPY